MSEVGKLRIYGAGGCGINIAQHFQVSNGKAEPGHAVPLPVFIDTSKSNISPEIDSSLVAVIEDVDGSGKVRRENSAIIARNIKHILQEFPPSDFNIVVFSASGGSGSVFAPMMIEELLNNNHPVVGIVVGSDESNITTQNTINTLKSLEAIAIRAKAPVLIHYSHNRKGVPRSEIDLECRTAIATLSLFSSKLNDELDAMDIANLVRFTRTTSAKPQLAILEIETDREAVENREDVPIAVGCLFNSKDAPTLEKAPEYLCVGYPRIKMNGCEELFFVVSVDELNDIFKMVGQRMDDLKRVTSARVARDIIVSDDEIDSNTGLVY